MAIGPRPSDLVAFKWSDFDLDEGLAHYVQGKTAGEVWAPLSPDMVALLRQSKAAARGLFVLADTDGAPLTYARFEKRFRAVREIADCPGYTLHGFRKNATIDLYEAGATGLEIVSCTGHKTAEMIKLYGSGANKKRLAKSAGGKLALFGGNSK